MIRASNKLKISIAARSLGALNLKHGYFVLDVRILVLDGSTHDLGSYLPRGTHSTEYQTASI